LRSKDFITKEEATKVVLQEKEERGVTFNDLAERIGRHLVWTTSALMGQQTMNEEEANKIVEYLDLDPSVARALQEIPYRGSLEETIPVDPLIYRFYEMIQVYGTSMKAIIHEEFGDGIMSAIDFTMDIERKPHPDGDRVVITLDGKFLDTKKW